MITISREELLKIASISQIEVSEDEITAILKEMSAILNYTVGVQQFVQRHATKNLSAGSVLQEERREDVTHTCDPEVILAQAPRIENNYFVVPVIIEHS